MAILSVTDRAVARLKEIILQAPEPAVGIRVSVRKQGCSGLAYHIDYAKEEKQGEDCVEQEGVRVFIDPAAVMFLFGSVMDWKEEALSAMFVFDNPNAKGFCGCGESFYVE